MYYYGSLQKMDEFIKATNPIVESTSSERYKDFDGAELSIPVLESADYKKQDKVNPMIGAIPVKKTEFVKTIPLANEAGSGFDEDVHAIAEKNHEAKIAEKFKTMFFEPFSGKRDVNDMTVTRTTTAQEPMKKLPVGW